MELKLKDDTQPMKSQKSISAKAVDAETQTDNFAQVGKFCQTESRQSKDFQNQTNSENQSITTQTERPEINETEVQVNIQPEHEPIPSLRSIKEEIAMPNLPNSIGQTHAKKRKLSTASRSCATSTDFDSSNTEQNLDAEILNSEVYKIYCRNEDPKEAMKQIRELKTCIVFHESHESLPNEADLKLGFDKALENLWSLDSSRWTCIERYMKNECDECQYILDACDEECIFRSTVRCPPRFLAQDFLIAKGDKILKSEFLQKFRIL